ncbi:DUF1501 domain-containing protein [Chitinasiproducens palmae]|uniref:Uncharacterized conserved protein, DUF1501 family n=1 Tax=Chitinasiproducens palmae TaxID=1770053 RepID=A0A1H2PX41_9BURK|nr:DUF1501 domain-containing protein [Chitinasiproducens palmae]SDV51623.1 Uncharacterized conserved protein, DUF1501 family [Chitinasiproducens palmae]
MKRRNFLLGAAAGAALGAWPLASTASPVGARDLPARRAGTGPAAGIPSSRLLILVELQGGNDAWNTVIPYAEPAYRRLRPTLAIPRDQVVQLDRQRGLHPALAGLLPAWQAGELAVVEGVGCPAANLSHFRAQQIGATASAADAYRDDGWVARALTQDGQARTAWQVNGEAGPLWTLDTQLHVIAADAVDTARPACTQAFATALQAALASRDMPMAAIKLTMPGFDTHHAQTPIHARLLGELATGLSVLRDGLRKAGRWDETLVMTYGEFGRRPAQNADGGTEHGAVSAQLLLGGRVAGGFHGAPLVFDRLDGAGDAIPAVDFRSVYASVLWQWWRRDPQSVLGGRFDRLPLLRV